jgi:type VI protein secretion system component Hcp
MSFVYIEFSAPIDDYCELDSASISNTHKAYAHGGSDGVYRSQIDDVKFVTTDSYLQTDLLKAVSVGTTFKKVTLWFYSNAGDLYLYYTFTNAIVSSVHMSGGGTHVAGSLNFESMSWEYFPT